MSTFSKRQLKRMYLEKLDLAIQNSLDANKASTLSNDIETAENYAKLLNMTHSTLAGDALVAVIIAVVGIAITAYLWSQQVPSTNIMLTVDTESIQGTLGSGWQIEAPLHCNLIHLENLENIEAPNLGMSINETDSDAWITIDGGHLSLQSLQIDASALIDLSTDINQLTLFSSRRRVRGRVTLSGKGTLTFAKKLGDIPTHHEYNLAVPETLDFSVEHASQIPARLVFQHPEKWKLGRMPLTNLGFAIEENRGVAESAFASAVKTGTIQFSDTSWPRLDIFEREPFSIGDTSAARIEIASAEPNLRIILNGLVKNVRKGAAADRDIAPSYLEYLYNKKSIGLFWGAIVFAWSVLWGIRKVVFR